jgi:hypothetical protein
MGEWSSCQSYCGLPGCDSLMRGYHRFGETYFLHLVGKDELTPWNRWVLLQKPPVTQLLKNFTNFIESEGSLPCSKEPATGPYPKPNESSPYPHLIWLRLILILSSLLRLGLPSGVSFRLAFPLKPCMHSSCLSCVLHALPISTSLT